MSRSPLWTLAGALLLTAAIFASCDDNEADVLRKGDAAAPASTPAAAVDGGTQRLPDTRIGDPMQPPREGDSPRDGGDRGPDGRETGM